MSKNDLENGLEMMNFGFQMIEAINRVCTLIVQHWIRIQIQDWGTTPESIAPVKHLTTKNLILQCKLAKKVLALYW